MTLGATINHASVIKSSDVPGHCLVAGGAIIRRPNVVEWLANGMNPVMAGLARFGCHVVIKACHAPTRDEMAVFAEICGFDMVCSFACSDLTIVAGEAVIRDFGVVNVDGCPG